MSRLLQLPVTKAPDIFRLPERRRAALGLVALFCLVLTARANNFTASIDPDTVNVGETATLTLTFEGGSPETFPSFPAIPNLAINDLHQTSTSISIVNGSTSSSESYRYGLTPTQPGVFTIPELTAKIGGQAFKTEPLKLTVLKPGTAQPGAADATQLAFVKLVLPKTEVYVGEILQAELQLYLQDGVRGLRDLQLTPAQAEGFTVGKMNEGQQRQTRVGGRPYTMVPFTLLFTAAKAGKLQLGPAGCTAALLLPPLDFFGQPTRVERVNLSSDVVTVQASPVPRDNVPPGFSGAVGNFTFALSASPTNIAVGDPITVKIQISGRGGLDSITLPDQPAWQQFKLYPPTSDFQTSDPLGITGTKSFGLTVVPQSLDVKELPPYAFSFFDPDKKQYRTIVQPAIPLTVRPSAASLPPPVASGTSTAPETSPAARDIVHIKARLGTIAEIQPPLAVRPWFIALQGVPVVAWLSLLVRRRQREKLAGNPRLRRQRQVDRVISAGLKELRRSANANEAEAFFATLFRLLQEQLGERLDLPASAITEAVVEERLGSREVPEETLALLCELFQACNQARYARQETSESLMSLVPKLETALGELRKIKG